MKPYYLFLAVISSCNVNEVKKDLRSVKEKIDLFAPCSESDLVLFHEIEDGNLSSLKKLIKLRGIDFHCNSEHGKRTISSVIFQNNYEITEYYLSHKDITQELINFITSSYLLNDSVYQSDQNKLEIFKLAIKKGGMISSGIGFEDLSLYESALKNGYDINKTDKEGNNAIAQIALLNDFEEEDILELSKENIDFLLSKGLKINHKNKKGETAIDLAANKKLKEYLKLK